MQLLESFSKHQAISQYLQKSNSVSSTLSICLMNKQSKNWNHLANRYSHFPVKKLPLISFPFFLCLLPKLLFPFPLTHLSHSSASFPSRLLVFSITLFHMSGSVSGGIVSTITCHSHALLVPGASRRFAKQNNITNAKRESWPWVYTCVCECATANFDMDSFVFFPCLRIVLLSAVRWTTMISLLR